MRKHTKNANKVPVIPTDPLYSAGSGGISVFIHEIPRLGEGACPEYARGGTPRNDSYILLIRYHLQKLLLIYYFHSQLLGFGQF